MSKNSTTVTDDPSRDHTDPISRPIYPAPMTTSRSGTLSSESAPVDETICFSSKATLGRQTGSDPTAIIILSATIRVFFPLLNVTSTSVLDLMKASPDNHSTLFFLNKNSIPFVSSETTESFFDSICVKFT